MTFSEIPVADKFTSQPPACWWPALFVRQAPRLDARFWIHLVVALLETITYD